MGLLAVLERVTARARPTWTVIAVPALLVSRWPGPCPVRLSPPRTGTAGPDAPCRRRHTDPVPVLNIVEAGTIISVFTDTELAYLQGERRLARIATVGPDGTPHVTPVGWSLGPDGETIEVTGHSFAATKKFRDVARTGRAAIVIDEVLPPWRPRGIEVRGRAEALDEPEPHIRIHPTRIVSWGLDDPGRGHTARTVAETTES